MRLSSPPEEHPRDRELLGELAAPLAVTAHRASPRSIRKRRGPDAKLS